MTDVAWQVTVGRTNHIYYIFNKITLLLHMYTKIKSKILNVNNKKLKTLGDSIRESFDGHKVKWNFITKKKMHKP